MFERLRISPWTAVALAALVAAFCGNALAGSQAQQSAKPFTAKKAKRLFNKLIKKRAPSLSVANAEHAAAADSADTATTAANATNADSVGGLQLKELAFVSPASTASTELFNAGGLSISASCPGSVDDGPELAATATGAIEGALKVVGRGFFSPSTPSGADIRIDAVQLNYDDAAVDLDTGQDRGAAMLSFIREDGATVNGVISWDDGIRAGLDRCGVSGSLTVG